MRALQRKLRPALSPEEEEDSTFGLDLVSVTVNDAETPPPPCVSMSMLGMLSNVICSANAQDRIGIPHRCSRLSLQWVC